MPDHPNLAFIGKAGSGKDTAAELLIETLGYRRLAFADKLKDVAESIWGPTARTDRDKLQKLGEYVRNIDEDAWVNAALAQTVEQNGQRRLVDAYPGSPVRVADDKPMIVAYHPIIVTDCRYRNEAWTLQGEDFVIVRIEADRNERINRLRSNGKLGPDGWEDHVSETDLDTWPADYNVQNLGSKADLLDDLARVLALESGATAP
jgi:dephospho-CoA kinase